MIYGAKACLSCDTLGYMQLMGCLWVFNKGPNDDGFLQSPYQGVVSSVKSSIFFLGGCLFVVRIRHIKDDWRGFNASFNFLILTDVEPFLNWISRTSRFPYVVGRCPALELLMLCYATNLENPANLQPSQSLCNIFPYIVVIREFW